MIADLQEYDEAIIKVWYIKGATFTFNVFFWATSDGDIPKLEEREDTEFVSIDDLNELVGSYMSLYLSKPPNNVRNRRTNLRTFFSDLPN